nr:3-deoxy-7-phosphoheptulonate synthase [Mangrovitalea sediminis]
MPMPQTDTAAAQSLDAGAKVSRNRAHALPTPAELKKQLPLPALLDSRVATQRRHIADVIQGRDSRLLVIVGPCSIHDEDAALDYGERLATLAAELDDRLLVVMRAYLEKPRTTVGWKGLLYDPQRDGSAALEQGLVRSRRLLMRLADLGLPLATEALNPLAFSYLDDLLAWTAIGARTTESQPHRELASGLDMAVGFKNGTDGGVEVAINAMQAAARPHHGLGIDAEGRVAMCSTEGNPDTHVVLRGGRNLTNYDVDSIGAAQEILRGAGLNPRVIVDCSHDNACKQPERQPGIAHEVLAQRLAGNQAIAGVMLESFLEDGRQAAEEPLQYGVSITDPCIGWARTEALLRELHDRL